MARRITVYGAFAYITSRIVWITSSPPTPIRYSSTRDTPDSAATPGAEQGKGRRPPKPVVDGEPPYEDHPIDWKPEKGWFDDYDVRKKTYWSLFAGAFGAAAGRGCAARLSGRGSCPGRGRTSAKRFAVGRRDRLREMQAKSRSCPQA